MTALRLASRGICSPVGHTANATITAIRAHINHFRDTGFVDDAGQPLKGGLLYEVPCWGEERLHLMLDTALRECLNGLDLRPDEKLPVLLLASEPWRGERYTEAASRYLWAREPHGGHHDHTGVLPLGKAGIAAAIDEARKILCGPDAPRYVLLAAADTYLDAPTVEQLLNAQRLLTTTNSDGMIAGEGACALALTRQAASVPTLWIDGIGEAREAARVNGEQPNLARGLVAAIRAALREAGAQAADMAFHASGVSGESWYFREAATAMTRVMTQRVEAQPHRLIAQSVGEVGAAAGPMTLAWLADVMGRDDGPGQAALLHFSNDDGLRSALVVRYRD